MQEAAGQSIKAANHAFSCMLYAVARRVLNEDVGSKYNATLRAGEFHKSKRKLAVTSQNITAAK